MARMDERTVALRDRVTALDQLIIRELEGFPQTYAKGTELQALVDQVAQIRLDHVQRSDMSTLRDRVIETEGRLFRLYGGMMVLAVIGAANLIRVFTG